MISEKDGRKFHQFASKTTTELIERCLICRISFKNAGSPAKSHSIQEAVLKRLISPNEKLATKSRIHALETRVPEEQLYSRLAKSAGVFHCLCKSCEESLFIELENRPYWEMTELGARQLIRRTALKLAYSLIRAYGIQSIANGAFIWNLRVENEKLAPDLKTAENWLHIQTRDIDSFQEKRDTEIDWATTVLSRFIDKFDKLPLSYSLEKVDNPLNIAWQNFSTRNGGSTGVLSALLPEDNDWLFIVAIMGQPIQLSGERWILFAEALTGDEVIFWNEKKIDPKLRSLILDHGLFIERNRQFIYDLSKEHQRWLRGTFTA